MLKPILNPVLKAVLISVIYQPGNLLWYDKFTGVVCCSVDLIECNKELITCL